VVQKQNEHRKSVFVKTESRDRPSLDISVNLLMFNPKIYFQYYRVLHHDVTWVISFCSSLHYWNFI